MRKITELDTYSWYFGLVNESELELHKRWIKIIIFSSNYEQLVTFLCDYLLLQWTRIYFAMSVCSGRCRHCAPMHTAHDEQQSGTLLIAIGWSANVACIPYVMHIYINTIQYKVPNAAFHVHFYNKAHIRSCYFFTFVVAGGGKRVH